MAAGSNIIGEVGLKVVPVDPAAQFQAGVDQLIRKLEKQAQFQVKASGLTEIQDQANQAGQAFANAAIQAAGLTAAIFAIRQGIEGAVGKLSGLFDQLAQARAGFTSILHSEAAGGKLLDDIREFARVSPFITQELVNYSQQLLGVGLNAQRIIPLLKSTGDIISSVGGDTSNLSRVLFTLTQIKSIGVLKGQDTMQLQNSLIPITKYLADYLHKSAQEIVKLREAGLITADTVFNALNQQGDKVKGAMDRATRNIQGARAILSDTITQLFQNQPVLNKIFEDVFKSIQRLADKIGEAEFQNAFSQFFDGINKVYEGLKPILSALAGIANSGAITGMQAFGSALGAIGEALNAIPQVAVEAFARLLAAIIAVRAPLLLLRYVTSIQTLARSIIPATSGLAKMTSAQNLQAESAARAAGAVRAETLAFEMQTKALTLNQQARARAALAPGVEGPVLPGGGRLGRVGNAAANALGGKGVLAAYGATLLGTYLQQQNSTTAKTAGGALQGAGTGFLVGGLPGAAVGATIGGIVSYLGAEDAKIKKHTEEMKQKGKDDAKAFIDATNKEFNDDINGDVFTTYNEKIKSVSDALQAATKAKNDAFSTFDFDALKAADSDVTSLLSQLQALQGAKAAAFDPINFGIERLVENLDVGSAGYNALTTNARGGLHRIAGDTAIAQKAAEKYGFTIEELGDPDKLEGITNLIKNIDGLTTAQQQATLAATKLVDAFDTAKKAAATAFDSQEKLLSNQIEIITSRTAATSAAFAAGAAQNDPAKQLQFQQAALKAQELAFAVQSAKDADALAALKERIKLSSQGDPEAAKAGAAAVTLFNEGAASRADAAGKLALAHAIEELGAARRANDLLADVGTDAQIAKTEKLLGLIGNEKNKQIIITVETSAVQKAQEELTTLFAKRDDPDVRGHQLADLNNQIAAVERRIELITGGATPADQAELAILQKVTDEILKQTKATEELVSPWKKFIDGFDQLKSTGDLLGSLFEVNDDNVVALNATAENLGNVFRTLAEQADAIFNQKVQAGASKFDAEAASASSLAANLELVQLTLKQTDAEFADTLANAGLIEPTFSGFAGTFEAVAQQLGVPRDVLQDILNITGQIPTDMNLVVTADAAQAIAELQRLRALYLSDPVLSALLGGASAADQTAFQDYLAGKTPIGGVAFGAANKPVAGAGSAAKDAADAADRVKSATDALASKLQEAADSIVEAAKAWVGSIKERTQYEKSISASTAIRNTQRQIKDLTELSAGLVELRARGLSEEAIKSLGIDNVADVRQVRKLLRANPGDIATLSAGVAQLTTQSQALAATEEDRRTQKNITEGIIAAAETLEIDFSKTDAAALANTFHITTFSDADAIAAALISALSSGRIGR